MIRSNLILFQNQLDGPGGNIKAVALILYKNEGCVILWLMLRKCPVSISKVDEPPQILKLLLPPQPVHIGEYRPKICTAQTFDGHGLQVLIKFLLAANLRILLYLSIALDDMKIDSAKKLSVDFNIL